MSYARKNRKHVAGSIIGIIVLTAIAIWQFYLYVTFKNASGLWMSDGGSGHLWWAIGMAVSACCVAFVVFSVFQRHDVDDELHITFAPSKAQSSHPRGSQ